MKTRIEIKNELTQIATGLGITGLPSEALIALLSHCVYWNQFNFMRITLESSFQFSKNLNSRIQKASDKLYSVSRGINQRITFKGIIPLIDLEVEALDFFAIINGVSMYHANNMTFQKGVPSDVSVIVGEELFQGSPDIVESISAQFEVENLSSHLVVKLMGSIIPHFEKFSDYNSFEGMNPDLIGCLVVTSPSYGVTIWVPKGISSFGDLEIKAIKYCEKTIDPTKVKSIPNFSLPSAFVEGENCTVTQRIPRNEDKESIFFNAIQDWKTSFVVRSHDDLPGLIKSLLTGYVQDVNIMTSIVDNLITIYYTRSDFSEIPPEVITIIENLKKAYYIPQELSFVKAVAVPTEVYIKVFYNSPVNTGEVDKLINATQYVIGTNFKPYKLLNSIGRLEGVAWAESNLSTDVPISTGEHILFSPLGVTYEAVRL